MSHHAGIILKQHYPKQRTLCIFDRIRGKIECTLERMCAIERFSVGMLVFYQVMQQRRHCFAISGVDIVRAPFTAAKHDLLFVHHVLEMVYYFTSFEQRDTALFEVVTFACLHAQLLQSIRQKKLFLFKLFAVLGMYPESDVYTSSTLHCLAAGAIDNLFDLNIDLEIERELDYWLLTCIAMHPSAKNFKTGHFITKNRVS